jgi:hypothetical protein
MNNDKDIKLLRNKRLHFVLYFLWLIASFFIIKRNAFNIAYDALQFDIANCNFKFSIAEVQSCIDEARDFYNESLATTPTQLIDTITLFIIPIVLLLVLAAVIKWIRN